MNHEWLKILLSAVVGMFTGLVADPIRETVATRMKLLRLEKAIALDCFFLKMTFLAVEHGMTTNEQVWKSDMLAGFKYNWEHNRELFYHDLRMQTLRLQLQTILMTQERVGLGQVSYDEAKQRVQETLESVAKVSDDWESKTRIKKIRKQFSLILKRFV